ncbi:MAG: STAS domain-containing protein [Candidatus Gracilibacteria bacterium]|nr:STAS domain-containing protein [Candidatus Gracilibacteria bacterium]
MNTAIEIKTKQVGSVMVFEFHGELDETNADKTFTSVYNAVGDFTGKKILFNLVGLKYLNSKSIGYIADIFSNIEDGNGQMCISNMTEEVKDTLELVGITTIVSVTDTEAEALSQMA